jgi:hypothetical protein
MGLATAKAFAEATPSAEDERYGVLDRTNELSFHLRKASENGVSRDAILEAL